MTVLDGLLEQALTSADAQLDEVLDVVDAAVEDAAARGDATTLVRLAERLDDARSTRGGEWAGLAVAAARARALATSPARSSSLPDVAPTPARPQPPAAEKVKTASVPAPGAQFAYAGWWRRVFALVLDAVVVGIALSAIDRTTGAPLDDIVLAPAYFAVFPAVAGGITPGKAALGIAIRRVDGTTIGLVRSLWRVLSMWLLWVTVVGAIVDVVLAGADEKRQSVHDKLAGTIVLRTRA